MEAIEAILPQAPLTASTADVVDSADVKPDLSSLLRLIPGDDLQGMYRLAATLGDIPELWDDRSLIAPALHFADMYINWGLTFDIADGGGMIAFNRVQAGYRCQVSCALWTRDAMRAVRNHGLWQIAARVAIQTHNLLVIDGFIQSTNRLARRNAERNGMRLRGIIKNAGTFQGVHKDMAWYEIHRDDLEVSNGN